MKFKIAVIAILIALIGLNATSTIVTMIDTIIWSGTSGLSYGNILGVISAFLIFTIICILAAIGLFTVIKWIRRTS